MTDAVHPAAHRTQMRRAKCNEPTGDAMGEYRRVREQLCREAGWRKRVELCATLDELWWKLTVQEKRQLLAEFTERDRGRR